MSSEPKYGTGLEQQVRSAAVEGERLGDCEIIRIVCFLLVFLSVRRDL